MIRAIIGVVALLLIVGGIVGGVYYWNKMKEPENPPVVAEGPDMALGDEALDMTDAEIPGEIIPGGDEALAPEDGDAEEVVIPIGEEEAPVDLSGGDIAPVPEEDDGTPRGLAREENPIPETPVDEGTSVVTAIEPVAATPIPTATPIPEATSAPETTAVEPAPAPTATPIPTTPVVTPAPTVAAGNYGVYTTAPVPASKLKQIEDAMKSFRVTLQKQQIATQQRQAYRVALGFYRTKQEAKAWANQYLRPKKIDNYVYPAQGMYSIQLGVYTEKDSIDRVYRSLYQQFPGWRLPLRTEMTMLDTRAYQLSVRGITEGLAKQVQNALFRLQVPAELAGI